MRNGIFILLVLMGLSKTTPAQKWPVNYQVIYDYTYQKDSNDAKSPGKERMELLIHDSLTVFQAVNKGLRDSMFLARGLDPNNGIPPDIERQTRHDLRFSIFRRNNKYLVQHNYTRSLSNDATYKYYSDSVSLDWDLTSEVDTLNGVPVQKALVKTQNTIWEAWFAPGIPIQQGPYLFSGLPGLIIKIQDKNKYWTFELMRLTTLTNRTIDMPARKKWGDKLISKSDFIKERNYYIANATILDIANKQVVYTDERYKMEDIKKDKERAAKNNLWLEREF